MESKKICFKKRAVNHIWDPVSSFVSKDKFSPAVRALEEKYEGLTDSQSSLLKRMFLSNVLIWIMLGLASLLTVLLGAFGEPSLLIYIITPLLLGVFSQRGNGLSLQKDIVKWQFAQKNNLIYNPEKNPLHWQDFATKYPVLFDKGTLKQYMTDEFWGKIKSTDAKEHDFYCGIFHYAIKEKKGKNRKSISHFSKTVFAIRLDKKIKHPLLLLPELGLNDIGPKSKDIELESEAFNQCFRVKAPHGEHPINLMHLYKNLTPVVQEKLMELVGEQVNPTIYFVDDVFFFVREGFLFPSTTLFKKIFLENSDRQMNGLYSNLTKNGKVDARDEDFLEGHFKRLVEVSSGIAKNLD